MNEKEALYLKAKQAYYFGTPIMSDAQFDELEKEEELKNSPVLSTIGAPIPNENLLTRAVHRIHMGSQEKVNNYEEFERWQRLRLNDNKELLHASYKADGGSISLCYE
jgi:NAD-dependent DNA ligase